MRVTSPETATDLLEVATRVVRGVPPNAICGLVAADEIAMSGDSAANVALRAVSQGGWHATGRSYILAGNDLKRLLLVAQSEHSEPCRVWIIDGWSLLAAHGAGMDLRGARLRGAQLGGARLRGALLDEADLAGADLEKCDLSQASLVGASLVGASLFCGSLKQADLTEADFARADLRHVDLRDAICVRTAFRGADVWGAYMWNVDLSKAFTAGADFTRADYLNEVLARENAAVPDKQRASA